MLIPLEADVESEPMLLALVLTPEDSELAVVEADVESDETLLFAVLRPVDSDVTPL